MRKINRLITLVSITVFLLLGCGQTEDTAKTYDSDSEDVAVQADDVHESEDIKTDVEDIHEYQADMETIPEFNDDPYVVVNNNEPEFDEAELVTESFEEYSSLDELGRCHTAYANIGQDIMPTKERGKIGQVKPSGWHTYKYNFVDGKYLYNRCHLIGYQLSAENANEENLITGTRYFNVEGMLPFENMVADYVKETDNHVLYRVTPIYEGDNMVASGVLMEAMSVEDEGSGIKFCVYVYNNQPGVDIDYATGESHLSEADAESAENAEADDSNTSESSIEAVTSEYVVNENTHKFHQPDCSSVKRMKDSNKRAYTGSREELINEGYEPCKNCNP